MDDEMTFPHEDLERRVALLEAAVARIMREGNAAAAPRPAAQPGTNPELPRWAEQWLDRWDSRGIPRARVASPHECRQKGGQGKGDWAGDPSVRKDPPRWKDGSQVGRPYSICPVDFLKMLADFEEWKAMKTIQDPDPEKRKYVTYNLRAASLAKGWAAILSDPAHRPGADLEDFGTSDANEDIPF
jgi:hypothetical protein